MKRRGPKRHHEPAYRDKVFRIWLHNEQNCTQASKIAERKLGIQVSVPTITRWRDKYDWEMRAAVYNNELQRMMRMSDDPVLQQLAMDDLETARVLAEIQHIMRDVLRNPKKYGMYPKNINEVVTLLKYARDERERIGKKGAAPGAPGATPQQPGITYYDQRKLELKTNFEQLPPDAQRTIVGQFSQVMGQTSKALKAARSEAFADDE